MIGEGLLGMRRIAKPWGRVDLPQSFASSDGERVGEIWFERPDPLAEILVKYLFTSERLSVQVHPLAGLSPTGVGKDECWLVTEAAPGARLAIGFREEVDRESIRASALEGTVEDLLDWREISVDDFIYVPSGTVHAIGPGLTLVEVQQNTEITYRLYDYGRDRELHLDEALLSVICSPHPAGFHRAIDPECAQLLVEGPYFTVAHCVGEPGAEVGTMRAAVQVVPLRGQCRIGGSIIEPGQSGWAETVESIDFANSDRSLLVFSPRCRE